MYIFRWAWRCRAYARPKLRGMPWLAVNVDIQERPSDITGERAPLRAKRPRLGQPKPQKYMLIREIMSFLM